MGISAWTALGGRLASIDALSLIWQASWLVQLVIGLLLLLSIFSWAIILAKWRELRRAEQDSEAFLEVYQEGSLDAAYQLARQLERSPLASMFVSAYAEFNRMARFGGKGKPGGLSESQIRALSRQLGWAGSREGLRLERGLSFLATTGSAAPFIGLFGTVWGIMVAFSKIAAKGSSSIVAVAPGIAEALITTAAGLVAAVPALIAYNNFNGKVRVVRAEMNDFALEFLNLAERHFT